MWISLWVAAGLIVVAGALLVLATDEVVHRIKRRQYRKARRLTWKP